MGMLLLFLPFKLLYAVACHFSALQTTHRCFGCLLWHAGDRKRSSTPFQWFCLTYVCECCQWGINLAAFVWNLFQLWSKTMFQQDFQHCSHRLNTCPVYSHHSQCRRGHNIPTELWCCLNTDVKRNMPSIKRSPDAMSWHFFTLTQSWMIHMDVNVWTRLWALSKSMPKWLPVRSELSACCFDVWMHFFFFFAFLMWHKK